MKDTTFQYIWEELVLNTIESYNSDFTDEDKKKYRFEQPANVKAKTEHEESALDTVLA